MKQALQLINEIKADYSVVINADSYYLIRDKEKAIKRKKHDLKEYCFYKKLNYWKLCKKYSI